MMPHLFHLEVHGKLIGIISTPLHHCRDPTAYPHPLANLKLLQDLQSGLHMLGKLTHNHLHLLGTTVFQILRPLDLDLQLPTTWLAVGSLSHLLALNHPLALNHLLVLSPNPVLNHQLVLGQILLQFHLANRYMYQELTTWLGEFHLHSLLDDKRRFFSIVISIFYV
jgi:hypothetical protein